MKFFLPAAALLCSVSSLPLGAAPGDVLFTEQFRNDRDFTRDWIASGSGSSDIDRLAVNSAPRSLSLSGDRVAVTTRRGRIDAAVAAASLSLWIRRGGDAFSEDPDAGEDLTLEYQNDSGSWITLARYAGDGAAGEVLVPSFALPADALHRDLRLRLTLEQASGNGFDFWHIDDVVLTETAAQRCQVYRDTFSAASYGNSDGSLNWSGNWVESDHRGGGATGGAVQISGGELTLVGNNTRDNNAVYRQLNASGFSSATLSFDFDIAGGVEAEDAALVQVSGNGGASYTQLQRIEGFDNASNGNSRRFDISAFMAADTRIRFAIAADDNTDSCCFGGSGEEIQFDNVQVEVCNAAALTVDHYVISHASPAVTCEAANITITARDRSGAPVDPPAGTVIALTTSAANDGWALVSGNGSLSGNRYTYGAADTAVVVALTRLTPVTGMDIDISDGIASDNDGSAEDPAITFVDAALRFYADGAVDGIAAQVAGKDSDTAAGAQAIALRAIHTDPATGACTALINGTETIGLSYECENPATCFAPTDKFSVNGHAIGGYDNAGVAAYTGVPLSFDASGSAALVLNYSDAGQIQLHASANVDVGGAGSARVGGASNSFVVLPDDLLVSRVESAAAAINPGTTVAAPGFVAAGEAFRVVVEARNSAGAITPNFGRETLPAAVRLNYAGLVFPAGGGDGILRGGDSFAPTALAGQFASSAVSWSEVGTIAVRASIAGGDYLGAGDVRGSISGNIGRFYPHHFQLAASLGAACSAGGYSYMGQAAITADIALRARSKSGGTVRNYDSSELAFPTAGVRFHAENAGDGSDFIGRFIDPGAAANSPFVAAPAWDHGIIATTSASAVIFRRDTAPHGSAAAPDGPFSHLQLGVVLSDGLDGRSFDTALDFNPAASAGFDAGAAADGCLVDASCSGLKVGGPLDIRFGRLRLDGAHGPELADLPVTFITEYWNGAAFTRNSADACTAVPLAAVSYPDGAIDTPANRNVAVGAGSTTGNYASSAAGNIHFIAGDAGHFFSAPGSGGSGSFAVDVDLTDFSWLRYDWNRDGDFADSALPAATYHFGSYRGHDRIIFWREVLQ